jgi:putative FmdB family regulatory protein
MATFNYACSVCGLTYEVAREPSRADDEAYCPVCGEAIGRVRGGAMAKARSVARLFFHAHGDGPGQHRHW